MSDMLTVLMKARQIVSETLDTPEDREDDASSTRAIDGDPRSSESAIVDDVDLEKELTKFFPNKAARVTYLHLPENLRRIVDLNPQHFMVSYPDTGVSRRPEVFLRHDLNINRLTYSSCREALTLDFRWLNDANKNKCVVDLSKDGPMFLAPLHFLPPRCVLASALNGNMIGERVKYIQKIFEEYDRSNGGFKPVTDCRSGTAYVIRSEEYIFRAVIVGMGMAPASFRCVFLDSHGIIECERNRIFELPEEMNTVSLPSSLFMAKMNNVKWVPMALTVEMETVVTKKVDERTQDCLSGYLFGMTAKDDIPNLDWVHERSEWFSTFISKYQRDGLVLKSPKNIRAIPMTLTACMDATIMLINGDSYVFDHAKHGHPKYPLIPKSSLPIQPPPSVKKTPEPLGTVISETDLAVEEFQLYEKSVVPEGGDSYKSEQLTVETARWKEEEPEIDAASLQSRLEFNSCKGDGFEYFVEQQLTLEDHFIQKMVTLHELVSNSLMMTPDAASRRLLKTIGLSFACTLKAVLQPSNLVEAEVEKIVREIEEL